MKPKMKLALVAGVVLLGASCKQKSYETDKLNSYADSTTTSSVDTVAQKLVKTADIRFKVKNVSQASEDISALVSKDSGVVIHHKVSVSIEQTHDVPLNNDSLMRVLAFNTNADMMVKLPVEKVDNFLNSVTRMGIYVTERRMDIEDRSLDYLEAKLKVRNRAELVAKERAGKVVIKDPTAVINLKDDLVDGQINNKRIDDAVKYSVISLNFYQSNTIYKEVVANDDPSAYDLSFFKRMSNSIDNGWHMLADLIVAITNLWAFILAAIVSWLIFIKRKQIWRTVGMKS